MIDGFDLKDLETYEKNMLQKVIIQMPNECKKFIRAEGTKLKKITLRNAKVSIKKDTGSYFKSIKRGKAYKYKGNDAWAIRVYSYDPKAHLLEKGHRIVTRGKKIEKGFAKGFNVFENSEKSFQNDFYNDVETFIDNVLIKGLK